MRSGIKRALGIFAVIFTAAIIAICAQVFLLGKPVSAAESRNVGRTYYGEELKSSPLAQKFYGVLGELAESGALKNGIEEYDLVANGIVTESQIIDYIDNDSALIPVALGAARDAFYMDNPDLFYIDVYKLRLSFGMQGNTYKAYLGTGNSDNYYTDNTVSNISEAEAAEGEYKTALEKAVEAARRGGEDVVSRIKAANNYIVSNAVYDYGAYEDKHGGLEYDGYVNTAYGALKNGKALCGGFATAFKAVMDELDIPCVLISGAACPGNAVTVGATGGDKETLESGYEPHMWNAVSVDGLWYVVDVTWNQSSINKEKYLLVGEEFISATHVEDGVLSTSGFELKYPQVRPFSYGVNSDKNGFTFKDSGKIGKTEFGYSAKNSSTAEGDVYYSLTLGVSYDGKNFIELMDEDKYFAYRHYNGTELSDWFNTYKVCDGMANGDEEYLQVLLDELCADEYTVQSCGSTTQYLQFAVFAALPEEGFIYSPEEATNNNIISVSTIYYNDAYQKYVPSPYVKKITPDAKGYIQKLDPLKITLEFSEQLVLAEGKTAADVGVEVTGTTHDVSGSVKVENVQWNETTNEVSFTFTPSKVYSHNCETYNFVPTNLVGKNSGKVPEAGRLSFKMKQVVCSKVFNDGRLYMQVYGQPQFVSASDESLTEFKGKDGQPIVGDQRSQLMLVVNEPSQAESDAMADAAKDEFGLNDKDIMSSSTYQIDLQMCGLVQKVPTGSYMQVGFGFPDGYGPDDAGVTFTVYHYTRKANGEIDTVEAVPCVVTEYGIIATVKSFSPFLICAVSSDKVQSNKSLYAYVYGDGGRVDNGEILTPEQGVDTVYTFTPDEGYAIGMVTLNGTDVTSSVTSDNKLTVAYSQLNGANNSNVVEVTFVSNRVKANRSQNNFTVVEKRLVVTEKDMITAVAHAVASPAEPGSSNVTVVIVISIIAVVLVIAGVVVALLLLRKKKNGSDGGNKPNGNGTAVKTSAADTTKANRSTATAEKKTAAKPTAESAATARRTTTSTTQRVQSNATKRPSAPSSSARQTTRTAQPTRTASQTQQRQSAARTTVRPATEDSTQKRTPPRK